MRRAAALVLIVVLASSGAGCLENLALSIGPTGWPLEMVQADLVHEGGNLGAGVVVAVIDTGIDLAHPEFAGRKIRWLDLVNDRKDPYDDNGHGTHVAGIIAAAGDWSTVAQGFYLKGIAPDAELLVIKAIGGDGKGEEATVARGVAAAVQNGADVVVLSLGGDTVPVLGTETETEVNRAVDAGVFVVAAAGNAPGGSGDCTITSPASEPRVIAVGAVDEHSTIGAFSCRGTDNDGKPPLGLGGRSDPDRKPEIVAPGVDVLSAWKDPNDPELHYALASGTSQAAPVVGGVLALVLSAHPEYQREGRRGGEDAVERVKEILMTTALKVGPLTGKGPTAHDDRYGYGVVQAKAALDAL